MTRAGLIVNPRSGKSSGKGLALARMLQGNPNVSIKVIERFEMIDSLIDELAAEGVSDLFISSGDGTIQAIQTILAERRPFATLPRLALLPHGTTNMTAADLGFRHRAIPAQADFIRELKHTDLQARPTVRCVNPRDGSPRHGMFVGCGAVADATRFTQIAFNAKGVKGGYGVFATLTGSVIRSLFTKPDPNDTTRFDRPYPIRIEAQGRVYTDGNQLLMLATTLDKLVLNTRPYWGGKTGPMRVTSFPYPVPSIPRWLLPMMYGGEDRKFPKGAVSFCTESLEVTTPVTFVIDGEFFEPPLNGPLRLETGPVFTYVCR
ncbi:MAG: diacylglycerol kinase family protein [Hyphomicrobiales bacterium]